MHNDKDPFSVPTHSSGDLLHELDSLKALLDEERPADKTEVSPVKNIHSVEEYLRIKQAADKAGVSIDAYLARQDEAADIPHELEVLEDDDDSHPVTEEVLALEDEGEPNGEALLMELAEKEESRPKQAAPTTVEEYFAAVVAAKHRQKHARVASLRTGQVAQPHKTTASTDSRDTTIPLLSDAVNQGDDIPLLDEVAPEGDGPAYKVAISVEEMQELVDFIVNRKLQHLKPELEKEVMAELQKLLPISALSHT